jgi:hypothetical protein
MRISRKNLFRKSINRKSKVDARITLPDRDIREEEEKKILKREPYGIKASQKTLSNLPDWKPKKNGLAGRLVVFPQGQNFL